ncbi:MAG: hypothetical protein R6X33_08865, partial [Candidatus Brocadiia bacterium]
MSVELYINDSPDPRLAVRSIRASYVAPWRAELFWPGRHDAPLGINLWDDVRIEDEGGTVRFRGNITDVRPGGVSREGITFVAHGARFRLENEPVRINGRGFYVWNRRGHTCHEGQGGEDSPGRDGGKWTAGEIIVDILEHALGIPEGGSAISGHHGEECCATETYLTAADIAGYNAADWLACDSVVGEFSVDNTPVADAVSLLLALNGGFYGWYVDPASGELVLQDLDALPTAGIEAGRLGRWQDEAGTDYRLLENELEWSLEGVCSTILIQGTDRLAEEQPANIEDSGNPGKGDLGELELVAAPWRGFPAAYRPVCQSKRHPSSHPIDDANEFTPPEGCYSASHLPRVYVGTDAGPKYVYRPPGLLPRWLLPSGMVVFHEVPELDPGEKLWGWYWACAPFTVQAGPAGDAYSCYGYERTRTVYDPAFRHPTSWPRPGTADDETAMATLAGRLLRLYRDVRRQGTLLCDGVDFQGFPLGRRYDVTNLGADATGWTTTPEPPCPDPPTCWTNLHINAVQVTYRFDEACTEIRVANTFFMLEEYSELKRRLEMNLFAQRELDLSEELYDCQVRSPVIQDPTTLPPPTTEPPPTTTEAPTTTAEPTTTTQGPTT